MGSYFPIFGRPTLTVHLSLPSAGIIGMCYHAWLHNFLVGIWIFWCVVGGRDVTAWYCKYLANCLCAIDLTCQPSFPMNSECLLACFLHCCSKACRAVCDFSSLLVPLLFHSICWFQTSLILWQKVRWPEDPPDQTDPELNLLGECNWVPLWCGITGPYWALSTGT
jgi:hypothetical protein